MLHDLIAAVGDVVRVEALLGHTTPSLAVAHMSAAAATPTVPRHVHNKRITRIAGTHVAARGGAANGAAHRELCAGDVNGSIFAAAHNIFALPSAMVGGCGAAETRATGISIVAFILRFATARCYGVSRFDLSPIRFRVASASPPLPLWAASRAPNIPAKLY